MTRIPATLLRMGLILAVPAALHAQDTTRHAAAPRPETQAQMRKEAKITLDVASATALAAVPGGKVAEHELEREKGKLIYLFDIKVAGKSGTDEVNVDALTGVLVDKTHETPEDEAQEAAAENRAAALKKADGPV